MHSWGNTSPAGSWETGEPAAIEDPFDRPAPVLPLPARPDSVFVPGPDTADRLARRGALRVLLLPRVLVPVGVAAALSVGLLALTGDVVPALPGLLLPVLLAAGYPLLRRRIRRLCAFDCVAGTPMGVQLGPDGLDLGTAQVYVRIPYERIRGIQLRGPLAIVRLGSVAMHLPAGLFPEPMADRLRELVWQRDTPPPAGPPALPPLPTLLTPQAVFVAGPGTAAEMLRTRLVTPWRRTGIRVRTGLLATGMVALGWWIGGGRGALMVGAVLVLTAVLVGRAIHAPSAELLDRTGQVAAPGRRFAAQFGSDALVLQTSTELMRVAYPDLTGIEIGPAMTVVGYGHGQQIVLPSELLPDFAQRRLIARGIRVTHRAR